MVAAMPQFAGQLISQAPPSQVRHATYDFTEGPSDPNLMLEEVWVDSKSPGDGWTYSVGTIEVVNTLVAPMFSSTSIEVVDGLAGFPSPAPLVPKKQVVVIQAVNALQEIQWQRFYYGFAENGPRYANARGISVWPAENPADTRVAICGESTHDGLPLDQGVSFATGMTKGFIAVLRGNTGEHLWSHQFFGRDLTGNPTGNVAVTDVSIRVEDGTDIVTYCGTADIGTGGLDAESMQPKEAFLAPAAPSTCTLEMPAGGATDTGSSWDGFVGRITFAPGGQRDIAFHSSVGGDGTDGLFGIAEITPDRFVVVGATGVDGLAGGSSGRVFPFTDGACVGATSGNYRYGVVMEFDATATTAMPAGALVLSWSHRIGTGGTAEANTFTSARDVVVQRGWDSAGDMIAVVGQTNDAGLFASLLPKPLYVGPQDTIGGGDDGYLLTVLSTPGTGPWIPFYGTYRGEEGDDALTGVQSWNEFVDHVAVVGYFDDQDATQDGVAADIEVSSYWLNTSGDTSIPALVEVRRAVLGSAASYQPTALGAANMGFEFLQGGGITVNDSGRVTVAGAYTAPTGLYLATAAQPTAAAGRPNNNPKEAYRAVLDMLPGSTGRTDGTGVPVPAPGTQYPLSGVFGGSTPECALVPFGNQVGVAVGTTMLSRMLIDYVSPGPMVDPTAGHSITLVVDRPPSASIQVAAWQLGFPGVGAGGGAPAPVVLPDGVILWMVNAPSTFVFTSPQSLAQTWTLPAATSAPITVQLYCLLDPANAVPGGAVGPACPGTATTVASPALWFTF